MSLFICVHFIWIDLGIPHISLQCVVLRCNEACEVVGQFLYVSCETILNGHFSHSVQCAVNKDVGACVASPLIRLKTS